MSNTSIRQECLRAYDDGWEIPTGDEVREAMRLAGFSGSQAAKALGLGGDGGARTVRRWIGSDTQIPYAVWALLCDFAGLGQIWRVRQKG